VIFVGILGFQVYQDSRQLSEQVILTKQYGFNNNNLPLLADNPEVYIGLPVNLVGRIDKATRIDAQSTQLSLMVDSGEQSGYQNVIVKFNGSTESLHNTTYVKISGSLQNTMQTPENDQTPYIIADKVEPIEDPWTILAPSLFTIYPGETVNQNGRIIKVEKVEFAESETRLFITLKNSESGSVRELSDTISSDTAPAAKSGSQRSSFLGEYRQK